MGAGAGPPGCSRPPRLRWAVRACGASSSSSRSWSWRWRGSWRWSCLRGCVWLPLLMAGRCCSWLALAVAVVGCEGGVCSESDGVLGKAGTDVWCRRKVEPSLSLSLPLPNPSINQLPFLPLPLLPFRLHCLHVRAPCSPAHDPRRTGREIAKLSSAHRAPFTCQLTLSQSAHRPGTRGNGPQLI